MKKSSIPNAFETRALMTGVGQFEEAMAESGNSRRLRMCRLIPESQAKAAPPGVLGSGAESSDSTMMEKADRVRFSDAQIHVEDQATTCIPATARGR